MKTKKREFWTKNIVVEAYQVEDDIEVEVTESRIVAKRGDWVVTAKDGKTRVIDNRYFHENYFEINDHLEDKDHE
jgi:hypothetical protein